MVVCHDNSVQGCFGTRGLGGNHRIVCSGLAFRKDCLTCGAFGYLLRCGGATQLITRSLISHMGVYFWSVNVTNSANGELCNEEVYRQAIL